MDIMADISVVEFRKALAMRLRALGHEPTRHGGFEYECEKCNAHGTALVEWFGSPPKPDGDPVTVKFTGDIATRRCA